MHEISIAGAIIDAVIEAAKKNNALKINKVFLEVGELTGLNPDQLKFIFKKITAGSLAEDAQYDIKVIKPLINCRKCSFNGAVEIFESHHYFLPVIKCPECSETDVEIIEGRECIITKMNIMVE